MNNEAPRASACLHAGVPSSSTRARSFAKAARIVQILNLYWSNPTFRWLTVMMVTSAIISINLLHHRQFFFAEEILTLLFIVSLWLSFQIGLLLKIQFSHFRSGTIPGFRQSHIAAFVLIYGALVSLGAGWFLKTKIFLPWISTTGMHGVWAVCLLVSLLLVILGYLSIGRLLLYGYCLLLIISSSAMPIAEFHQRHPSVTLIILSVWLVSLLVFLKRLTLLKEQCFEYGHLLTWPPNPDYPHSRPRPIKELSGILKQAGHFPFKQNIFRRTSHWNLANDEKDVSGAVLLVVLILYFLVWVKVPFALNWIQMFYNNLLVFMITPLVLTAVSCYYRMSFWDYELIRPFTRRQYFFDQIASVLIYLLSYWIFTIFFLAIVPAALFAPEQILYAGFWAYLLFSGSLVFLIIAVLMMMAAWDDARKTILTGGILSLLVIVLYDIAASLTAEDAFLVCGTCLAGGFLFIKYGYHA